MDDEELEEILKQAKDLRITKKAAVAEEKEVATVEKTAVEQEYKNEEQKCECWKCELRSTCVYRERYQRHSRSVSKALGLCKKLITFRNLKE